MVDWKKVRVSERTRTQVRELALSKIRGLQWEVPSGVKQSEWFKASMEFKEETGLEEEL